MNNNTYSLNAIRQLIDHYLENDGQCIEIEQGVLGYGKMLLYANNLKTCIVNEVYFNEWSSGHKVRFYNTTPKKYQKFVQ